jgi:hypothetical protein
VVEILVPVILPSQDALVLTHEPLLQVKVAEPVT